MLRLIEEEALKDKTSVITAKLPVDVTSFLLNEKRSNIGDIEARNHVQIIIIPDPNLETPHFNVERTRDEGKEVINRPSYELIPQQETEANLHKPAPITAEQPAVKTINAAAPVPQKKTKATSKPGFFSKLLSWLSSDEVEEPPKRSNNQNRQNNRSRDGNRGNNRNNNNRSGGNNRRRNHPNNRRRNDNSRKSSSNRNRGNGKSHGNTAQDQTAGSPNQTQAVETKTVSTNNTANTETNS